MANARPNNNWIGPVLGALIIVLGFIAYQEWSKVTEHERLCASLNRQFEANLEAIMGSGVVEDAREVGNLSPMLNVADQVAANSEVMRTLDVQCPGWKSGKYS